MDMRPEQWSSPSSSSSSREHITAWTSPPKRPAGRTKFKETRHPVYRGVRRRGGGGRWVCEVRVPGKRGERLWLGTYLTAEAAARAHDAAMLALCGRSTTCLNFPDSAWQLAVPCALSDPAAIRRAATEAVEEFLRREAARGAAAVPADEVTSSVSVPSYADNAGRSSAPPSSAENAISSATSLTQPCGADGMPEVPAALGSDMFELDMSGEMDLGTYYADLAEGLLLEPPSLAAATGAAFSENGDHGDGGADAGGLWSY